MFKLFFQKIYFIFLNIRSLFSVIFLNLLFIFYRLKGKKIIFFYHPRELLTSIQTYVFDDLFNKQIEFLENVLAPFCRSDEFKSVHTFLKAFEIIRSARSSTKHSKTRFTKHITHKERHPKKCRNIFLPSVAICIFYVDFESSVGFA